MPFVILCLDKPNQQALRAETRPVHLAYLERFADRFLYAGPLMDDSGSVPLGSLLVVDMAERAEVEAFAAGDPYAKAGLFESVTIHPSRQVFPKP